jgi:hypothetical protein
MYSGGLAIGKMKPGAGLITNPVSPHKTYDTQLAGEYFGGLEQSLPKEILFPDWYKMRREINAPVSGDVRSFQLSKPIQSTNQEWLDNPERSLGTDDMLPLLNTDWDKSAPGQILEVLLSEPKSTGAWSKPA